MKRVEKYIDLDGQELRKTIWEDGDIWYTNRQGEWHRLDGPAMIWFHGREEWYLNGKRHREDGPAIIWPSGIEKYYLEGQLVSKRETDLYWLKKQVCK